MCPPDAPSQLSNLLASCLFDPELGQQEGKCPLWTGGPWTHLVFPHPIQSLYFSGPLCCSQLWPYRGVSWVLNGMGVSWA